MLFQSNRPVGCVVSLTRCKDSTFILSTKTFSYNILVFNRF
nr:MAG TPA: hypothetical protein [Caudoviricetes sp.]